MPFSRAGAVCEKLALYLRIPYIFPDQDLKIPGVRPGFFACERIRNVFPPYGHFQIMLNLQQTQRLQQKLSPQQIQYIQLLQLPTLALEQRIEAEMEENPLLEDANTEMADLPEERTEALDDAETERDPDEEYDWGELLDNTEDLYGYKARVDYSREEEREAPIAATGTLTEHLREQLALQDLSGHEEIIAEQIIGSIDEDGYLRRPLESIVDDISFNVGFTPALSDIEAALSRIQRLDPIGIAARDLQECLLVQLRALPPATEGRDVAIRMLSEMYKAFTMKHFDAIQKKLRVASEELREAFDLIRSRLNPKPGEGQFTPRQNYITPDFTVECIDDEFIVTLNGRNAPPLHISRQYRQMLETMKARKPGRLVSSSIDADTRKFLKNKFESAKWFIQSIHQRRHTMSLVMHAIIRLQEDFFRYGEGHLKPMILNDVAEIVEMDISTVSRVVNGKYVQTRFGVYELKYFFSEGIRNDDGEDVSNKEIKAILEEIIGGEDKAKPLSDQRLVGSLADQGFRIARRTVTKYREQLGIPAARLRKEIVAG